MNQAQLLHQAKQRDLEAIQTLLNQSLNTRKLELIETEIEEDGLTLKVQSKNVPNQYKVLPFLRQEIASLGIEGIEKVKVYGMTITSEVPAWEESLALDRDWTLVNHLAKIVSKPNNVSTDEEESQLQEESSETMALTDEDVIADEEENQADSYLSVENDTDIALEEDELIFKSPKINFTINKTLLDWLPVLISLGIGFIWGVLVGAFFGYQKSMSILESSNSNTSTQMLSQPSSQ